MTPTEVATRFAAGPVPTPIPTIVINRLNGQISVENHTPINFNLKGYTISSVAGALDVTQWDSITLTTPTFNSGGGFDMIGVWTEQSGRPPASSLNRPLATAVRLVATTGYSGAWERRGSDRRSRTCQLPMC